MMRFAQVYQFTTSQRFKQRLNSFCENVAKLIDKTIAVTQNTILHDGSFELYLLSELRKHYDFRNLLTFTAVFYGILMRNQKLWVSMQSLVFHRKHEFYININEMMSMMHRWVVIHCDDISLFEKFYFDLDKHHHFRLLLFLYRDAVFYQDCPEKTLGFFNVLLANINKKIKQIDVEQRAEYVCYKNQLLAACHQESCALLHKLTSTQNEYYKSFEKLEAFHHEDNLTPQLPKINIFFS